jgi:hypothetical protein
VRPAAIAYVKNTDSMLIHTIWNSWNGRRNGLQSLAVPRIGPNPVGVLYRRTAVPAYVEPRRPAVPYASDLPSGDDRRPYGRG